MNRLIVAGAISALAGAGILGAAPAQAEGLGGITGWQPVPSECGRTNYVPVVITNATDQSQTGSVTVPYGTATQVGIFTSQDGVYSPGSLFGLMLQGECPNMTYQSPAPEYQRNVTGAPGETVVFWMAAGGLDQNLFGDSMNIGFGGLPSNTPGQSWYDLNLNLGLTESFEHLSPNYTWTGGTNTTNNQNGFNLVKCDTNGGVFTTDQVLTPAARGFTPNNVPWYFMNDPICAAWLPVGQMIPVSEANVQIDLSYGALEGVVESVNGLQLNATSPTYNIAGTFTSQAAVTSITSVSIYNSSTGVWTNASLDGTGTTGTNAFFDADGWSVQNVPASPGDALSIVATGGDGYGSQVNLTIPS